MIPDYCDAITAYRVWDAHSNGLLVGQAQAEPWPPYQAFAARCGGASRTHIQSGQWIAPPVWGCGCGIHALKTYEAALERVTEYTNGWTLRFRSSDDQTSGLVWGTVKLWGRLIEHDLGWRAEFAYPSELWTADQKLAKRVASLYGVPCGVRDVPKPEPLMMELYWSPYQLSPGAVLGIDWADAPPDVTPAKAPPVASPSIVVPQDQLSRWQRRQGKARVPVTDWRAMMHAALHANVVITDVPSKGTVTPVVYGIVTDGL